MGTKAGVEQLGRSVEEQQEKLASEVTELRKECATKEFANALEQTQVGGCVEVKHFG